MSHSEVRKLLSAYVDGELGPDVAGAVKEHVGHCEACARYLERLRTMDESVRSTRPEMPPEGYFEFFPSKLAARIRSEGRGFVLGRRMEVRLARVRAAATALVVLMAFGVGFIYGQRETPVPMVRLTPIPLLSEPTPALELAAMDEIADMEQERLKTTAMRKPKQVSEPERKERKFGRVPEAAVLGERVVPGAGLEVGKEAGEPSADVTMTEAVTQSFPAAAGRRKGPESSGAAEAYAMANLAQLQYDYDSALDGYGRVLASSPGTDLASAAQYQINVMKTDTSGGVQTLRESARLWEEYINQYPGSSLILSACNWYTESLYLIARKTKSRLDAERALSAIEDCSRLVKEKMPADYREKVSELRGYLRG